MAPGPPSWQTPFMTNGHTSSQISGGGGGGGKCGSGEGGGGGGDGFGSAGSGGGLGLGGALPQSQQFADGTPKSDVSAHSCPGTMALLAQWPSLTYFAHVPPNWLRQEGVSMHGSAVGGSLPPPHAQQFLPASPYILSAAHSWPAVNRPFEQWPSPSKSAQVAPNGFSQSLVSWPAHTRSRGRIRECMHVCVCVCASRLLCWAVASSVRTCESCGEHGSQSCSSSHAAGRRAPGRGPSLLSMSACFPVPLCLQLIKSYLLHY